MGQMLDDLLKTMERLKVNEPIVSKIKGSETGIAQFKNLAEIAGAKEVHDVPFDAIRIEVSAWIPKDNIALIDQNGNVMELWRFEGDQIHIVRFPKNALPKINAIGLPTLTVPPPAPSEQSDSASRPAL